MKQELFFAPLRVVLCAALLPEENQNNNEARQKYCRSPLPDGCERKECLKMTIDNEIHHATKPGANLFLELGFDNADAVRLQAKSQIYQ